MDRGKSRDTGPSVFWGTVQQGGRRMGLGARQRVHLTALTSRGPGWPTTEPHPITCERGDRQTQRCQRHTRQEAQPAGPERHVQLWAAPCSPRPGLLQGAGGLWPAQPRWPVPGHPRPTCSGPSAQPTPALADGWSTVTPSGRPCPRRWPCGGQHLPIGGISEAGQGAGGDAMQIP